MRHTLGRRHGTATRAKAPPAPPAARGLAGAPAVTGNADAGNARLTQYERLARVSIRHTFYNASGGECRDFTVRPTGFTQGLLHNLGMLCRPEPDGFSVLYDALRTEQLISYLAARRTDRGAWTRLSFLLSLRNPYFVSISDLPINTNASVRNFYLTNQQAHWKGKMVLLTPGSRVTAAELKPVTGGQLVQPVTPAVEAVRLLDLSGTPVLCEPRCKPVPVMKDGEASTEIMCTDRVFLDFSTLPEDLYTVQEAYTDGTTTNLGKWLYTSLFPMPLCYVELLFSDPDGTASGVYPVVLPPPGQATGGAVAQGGVDYTLRFTRRETWWSYYVMPQAPRGELHDLRIEHLPEPGSGAEPRVRFLGPCQVRLPGGRRAWRFLSACPLPLEQRSRLHLRLHGRTARMTRADVLMDRLPVASPQQVLPIRAEVAHEQALESLVGDPPPRCRRLLDRLLDPGACRRRRAGTGARSPPSDFSDIYVHV